VRLVSFAVLAGLLLVSSAQADSGATRHRWQRTDLTPVTQPVAADGAFVFYDASGRHLHLVALDARTGKTLWSRLASVSDVTPGQSVGLDRSGSRIIALLGMSTASRVAIVSAVEAHSGRIVWSSPPGTFNSTPSRCPDERTVVCVAGSLENGQAAGRLRFDLATGRELASVAVDGSGAREIGGGLLDPGLRKPDYLVAVDGARTAWRVPLAAIFGAGSSTDYGWNFDRLVKPRLFIGSVGFTPLKVTKTFEIVDLAKQVNAGFRISDGSLVWRDRGAIFVCSLLPCPGQPTSDLSTPGRFVGLRLRMTGTLRATVTETLTPSRDATATLEGFDPANGRTIWSFDAGHSIGVITQKPQPPQTGAARIALRGPSGKYVDLDLRTGARHAVARTAPAWCRGSITYSEALPYRASGGRSSTTYVGEASLYPCNAAGSRTAIPAHVPSFVAAGSTTNGVVAWSDTTGVYAVPVS
jgi:PQQ-like domain